MSDWDDGHATAIRKAQERRVTCIQQKEQILKRYRLLTKQSENPKRGARKEMSITRDLTSDIPEVDISEIESYQKEVRDERSRLLDRVWQFFFESMERAELPLPEDPRITGLVFGMSILNDGLKFYDLLTNTELIALLKSKMVFSPNELKELYDKFSVTLPKLVRKGTDEDF